MLEYVTIDHGFEIRHAHEVMRVEQWGRDSVRVRCAQHAIAPTDAGALEAAPEPRDCSPAVRDGEEVRLVVGGLTVVALIGLALLVTRSPAATDTLTVDEVVGEFQRHSLPVSGQRDGVVASLAIQPKDAETIRTSPPISGYP